MNTSICGEGIAVVPLHKLGWNAFFEAQFERESGICPGRIVSDAGESYRLFTEHGELKGELAGRLRYRAETKHDLPAVGDWVVIQPMLEERKAKIHNVLPRRSSFVRKEAGLRARGQIVAANIDTVFVIVALNNDFNLRRIERYVAAVLESEATPVVVLSKSDLCDDPGIQAHAVEAIATGVPIHTISALAGEGLDALDPHLAPGRTVALVGSSGAGKSTLINKLFGSDIRRTLEIRSSDDRGRHATSSRDLIILPGGALVIDTPGMRELQLWDVDHGLSETFDDIDSLAQECRFGDCSHRTEPGCAVLDALESGTLEAGRIENFRKLRSEIEFLDLRRRVGAKRAEKQRWKKVSTVLKKADKRKGGF
jgi:ribosome biogenesis GTPase